MQILYIVGVGLLLNFDLACTDSRGIIVSYRGGARILRLGVKSVVKSLLVKGKVLCQVVARCR